MDIETTIEYELFGEDTKILKVILVNLETIHYPDGTTDTEVDNIEVWDKLENITSTICNCELDDIFDIAVENLEDQAKANEIEYEYTLEQEKRWRNGSLKREAWEW